MSLGDRLVERMLGLYGQRWRSQYGDAWAGVAADTWGSALVGLTPQQIADGLRACVAEGSEWPPSAPRFRAMCFGIPSIAAVKLELRRDMPSPFARLVWQHVDAYAHRQAQRRDADRMIEDAYDIAREHVMRGGELPPEAVGLIEHREPQKPQLPETPEERSARLQQLLGDLYNPATADPDYDPHEAHRRAQREEAERELARIHNPPSEDEG